MEFMIKKIMILVTGLFLIGCGNGQNSDTTSEIMSDSLIAIIDSLQSVNARTSLVGSHIHTGDAAKAAHQNPKKTLGLRKRQAEGAKAKKIAAKKRARARQRRIEAKMYDE